MTQTAEGLASVSHQTPDACTVVIFGAGGDLTKRLLWPALCNLGKDNLLPQLFTVVGCGRTRHDSKSFQQHLQRSLTQFSPDAEARKWGRSTLSSVHYIRGDALQATLHKQLAQLLQRLQKQQDTLGNVLFYLATPPSCFASIVQQLGKAGLTKQDNGWRRVVVEKPFGHDLTSAQQLNKQLGAILSEDQIFRIDHYLGKETVQNLLAFRFANGIFEPIWNRRYIDHVQITVAETLGVQQRAAYYETAGALRDMVPNHLFQLLSLITMEPPNSFAAHDVRDEKAKLLRAVHRLSPEEVLTNSVRGQYAAAVVDKLALPDYRQEPGVDPQSATETFVAFKLFVPNWRWAGVPFYLRTGKRLPKRVTEITIQFKKPPMLLSMQKDSSGINRVLPLQAKPIARPK